MTFPSDAKRLLVARLRALSVEGEGLSELVRRAAATAGIGERTLWRWLQSDPEVGPRRAAYLLTDEDSDEYAANNGNIAAVWRARFPDGGGPSLRTLQRAFDRELRPGDRAAVVDGAEGRRRHQVYLRWEARHRNEIWEADHKELEVLVRPPRCRRGQKPWVTMFLDAYSRLIMGWAIATCPSAASVLAALGKAIRVDPERGPFGGVPGTLRPDNGLEFAAASLAKIAGVIGCTLAPTPAYSPHLKGKLERANRTVTQELLAGLPFYADGPRSVDGRLYGPDAPPMTLEQFVEVFDQWVRSYNTARGHSALGGQTPLQRWSTDATPLQLVTEADLRWLLLADEERTILKDGVHFHGLVFVAPEMNARVGERVGIRYTPHDDRRIEIFSGEQWLATALPQNALSPADRDRVLDQRRLDAQEQGRRQRRASRLARVRLAAMTEPGAAETTTVIAGEADQGTSHRADDLALRRQARIGLLDLMALPPDQEPGTRPG